MLNVNVIMESVTEKYTRIGPSYRIKRRVTPVRKLVTNKKGTTFYRIYYVGEEKHRKAQREEVESGLLRSTEGLPNYITYVDHGLKSRAFRETPIEYEGLLGKKWYKEHAFVSGAELAAINDGHRATGIEPKVVSRKLTNNVETIKFDTGVSVKTTFKAEHVPDRSKLTLAYHNEVSYAKFREPVKSSIVFQVEKTDRGRELTITNLTNYDGVMLGAFVNNMSQKFDLIHLNEGAIRDPNTLIAAFQLGFKANMDKELFAEAKRHVKSPSKKDEYVPKIHKIFNESTSLSDFFQRAIKSGYVGKLPEEITTGIAKAYTKLRKQKLRRKSSTTPTAPGRGGRRVKGVQYFPRPKASLYIGRNIKLTFEAQQSKSSTKSLLQLHSYMLQKDPDNDYHLGMINKLRIKTILDKKSPGIVIQ